MPTNKYNRSVQDTLVECWRIFIMSRVRERKRVCVGVCIRVCARGRAACSSSAWCHWCFFSFFGSWIEWCCYCYCNCSVLLCCFAPHTQFIILSNRLSTWFGHVQISPPISKKLLQPKEHDFHGESASEHMYNAYIYSYSILRKNRARSIYGFVVFYFISALWRWISFRFRTSSIHCFHFVSDRLDFTQFSRFVSHSSNASSSKDIHW